MKQRKTYLIFAEIFNLLLADRLARIAQFDPAANGLTVSLVWQAEHLEERKKDQTTGC